MNRVNKEFEASLKNYVEIEIFINKGAPKGSTGIMFVVDKPYSKRDGEPVNRRTGGTDYSAFESSRKFDCDHIKVNWGRPDAHPEHQEWTTLGGGHYNHSSANGGAETSMAMVVSHSFYRRSHKRQILMHELAHSSDHTKFGGSATNDHVPVDGSVMYKQANGFDEFSRHELNILRGYPFNYIP